MKHDYPKVVALKDANRFPAPLEGYIIVGRLITDSPLSFSEGIPVPSLEKQLVDTIVNAKSNTEKDVARELQRAFDVYAVNQNKLARYASRRGVKEELDSFMNSLDNSRIEKFARLQKYFAGIPVTKAWLFGSFARCEETDSSDIDILFSYDEKVEVSLINIIRWKLDISKIFGREVDLVEDGFLRPFAQESADRDKYLIYERSN